MQLSPHCFNKISGLLEELGNSYLEFHDDPALYVKRRSCRGLPPGIINAPPDLIQEASEKHRKAEPCIFQLHYTAKSKTLMVEVSDIIMRLNNLNCVLSELQPIIEASVYEYVNLRLRQLFQSDASQIDPFDFHKDIFVPILKRRIKYFKSGFSKRVFEFPVVAFKLANEIQLSSNISLVEINPETFNEVDSRFMARFSKTRVYDVNFYLKVSIPTRCSDECSRNLARRVEGAMVGCINLITSYQSSQTVSFISANERTNHLSSFYRYGKNDKTMEYAQSYSFPTQIPKDDSLWGDLTEGNKIQGSLANRILNVPESIIKFSDKKNILLERVERSLTWFRDAVNESDAQVQIQKIVTSIEALVNFSDRDTTQSFIRRIVKLHSSEPDGNDVIEDRAKKLYKARSNIVHGSSLDERLDFSLIDFASKCVALGVVCYSMFGLGEPKNSKKIKAWLDSL